MNKYTIYCTKEQTERAYKLGAPIEPDRSEFFLFNAPTICIGETKGEYGQKVGIYRVCPTAEQMCGWLREKRFVIFVHTLNDNYEWVLESQYGLDRDENDTYENALSNAIDKALDYIETTK